METTPSGSPAFSGASPEPYLPVSSAILLVIGCVLLQVPVHMATVPLVGKNLGVSATMLIAVALPTVCAVLWLSPVPRTALRLGEIRTSPALLTGGTALSFTLLAGGMVELVLRWERLPSRISRLLEREELFFQEIFRLETMLDVITLGAALVIVAPVVEELLFRGVLQGSLERHLGSWTGVVTTALVFGVLHGQLRFLPVSLLGLLMGYMVMRTGSLLAGILAHSVHNLAVLCLGLVIRSHPPTARQLAAGAALGGMGLVIFLARFRNSTAQCAQITKKRRNALPPHRSA
jgi:membrane protease YdiL (CAAX protease family)